MRRGEFLRRMLALASGLVIAPEVSAAAETRQRAPEPFTAADALRRMVEGEARGWERTLALDLEHGGPERVEGFIAGYRAEGAPFTDTYAGLCLNWRRLGMIGHHESAGWDESSLARLRRLDRIAELVREYRATGGVV